RPRLLQALRLPAHRRRPRTHDGPAHPRGRPLRRRADRRQVAGFARPGGAGRTPARPPLPSRLRGPGPAGGGGGPAPVLPARPGRPAALPARRLLGPPAGAVLGPQRPGPAPAPDPAPDPAPSPSASVSQKAARARAVGRGWSTVGECSAPATTVRCARSPTAM